MASKITVQLDVREIIDRLSISEKIRLVKDLERETWAKRLDEVVSRVRKRFKQNPISEKEITKICEEARQQTYNARNKSRN
ncbi:hypothetical protein ACFL2Y_05470 [Candidatus Omnitrophota bacterium]